MHLLLKLLIKLLLRYSTLRHIVVIKHSILGNMRKLLVFVIIWILILERWIHTWIICLKLLLLESIRRLSWGIPCLVRRCRSFKILILKRIVRPIIKEERLTVDMRVIVDSSLSILNSRSKLLCSINGIRKRFEVTGCFVCYKDH